MAAIVGVVAEVAVGFRAVTAGLVNDGRTDEAETEADILDDEVVEADIFCSTVQQCPPLREDQAR